MTSPDADSTAERTTRVARVRSEIDAGIWVVIWLSLAFTAINVQIFAARGAEVWSLAWCAAWLLDPMVSILVLVVVRAEQITSRWQVQLGWPITATKWGCFAATYAMNTWSSWVEGSASMIVLHSVPPAMMLLAAEVGPRIRDGLTRAVLAATAHDAASAETRPGGHPTSPPKPAHALVPQDVAPAGARGPDPGVPPVGSGPGRVPDPAVVEVESPTTDTAAGSGPDRTDHGPDTTHTHADQASSERGHPPEDSALVGSALGVELDAADDAALPSSSDAASDDQRECEGPADPRVRLLRELLDSECAVTGAQAATLLTHAHGSTSDRTGRRLLAEARQARPADSRPLEARLADDGSEQRRDPGVDSDTPAPTHGVERDERVRTGTDGAPAPLSLVPRPPQPLPGDRS